MSVTTQLRTLITCAALALTTGTAGAQAEVPPPKPAKAEFGSGFEPPTDSEYGFPIGGFGGIEPGLKPERPPVIFVHGNTVDACNWKLVRDDFRAAGWSDQALWALSYNGLSSGKGDAESRPDPRCAEEVDALGGDRIPRVTSNDINVPDLHAFILAVREYTGSDKFSLVGHSLGVTVARATLKAHPELREDLVAFVGIAGGNDGTTLCPPGLEKVFRACVEIAPGTDWLAELNGPDGSDETYPPARWMTIYDGSGEADIAYVGADIADSPRLEGADNRSFPGTTHSDLRVLPEIVTIYREFIEQAGAAPRCTKTSRRRSLRQMTLQPGCG